MSTRSFDQAVRTCRTKQEMAALTAVWDRTFLNYTEEFPDRWHDPEDEFSEDLQLPEHAIPYLKKLTELENSSATTDTVQAYWEFFAAVWRIRFDINQLNIALPFLRETVLQRKDVPYFKNLLDAVETVSINAPDASADPHRHTQYLSKD